MTQDTRSRGATAKQAAAKPAQGQGAAPWWHVAWSKPAALRAVRATLVVPSMLALTLKVIGDPQMAVFAVFGSFGSLVLASFGGTRRDKAVAHLGLAVVGSIVLTIGTLASSSALLAGLVTIPVAFAIYFAGVAGPNTAAGVTAALLAYVLPVASSGGAATIGSRLAGWWLASAVSTAAVLLLAPRSAGDRLRAAASSLARALGHHVQAAVDGTATQADLDATVAAKHELMALYNATPYRPTGLAVPDQALASLVSLLEWCTSLVSETIEAHLNLSLAAPPDRDLLAESAAALRATAVLLEGGDDLPSLERVWQARAASAAHLRGLSGDPETVRRMADYAFHAQAIGVTASASAADALIAARRLDVATVEDLRRRWIDAHTIHATGSGETTPGNALVTGDGSEPAVLADAIDHEVAARGRRRWRLTLPRADGTIAADASVRSVWFRNSARGAVALAAAVAVARVTNVQHAFWVVLGTLSVLRTSAGATGSTALRAVVGTVIGFIVGAGLLVAIGTGPAALWTALVLAVVVAAYTPGTAPFSVGQAAFTVVVVVLFNLLAPAGWQVGLVRVEDVAIGVAVSVVVGVLFWPHGASGLVGDNLADALRTGAAHLTDATDLALGCEEPGPGPTASATAVVAAGIRLDDALRAYLTEQGSKRMPRQDLRTLAMSALRLRLTAHSVASLPRPGPGQPGAVSHSIGPGSLAKLRGESAELAAFYDGIAAEVSRPTRNGQAAPPVPLPGLTEPCPIGPLHYHPEALWVSDHLTHLGSHSAELVGPASTLAAIRRRPWWR